ncbi:MAG: 2-oxoacid:acceptor oxidoreductase family protein [Coriobacteriia bacterium]|nr:2-oxoacid:acceptor oxidoreductase family protein [Coriobacteriia bacterium]MCL2537203.1 2-oxoacid:acceptor oxidoreductase family protein [Coriobacteriia bacterium]
MSHDTKGRMTEIRWHARAGQGAVTAANLVAESALAEGRYFQAMPEFGPERMGAPLKAFTRLSDDPIEVSNNVEFPHIIVVLDDTLIGVVDVCEGLCEDGTVIVNTTKSSAEIREVLQVADSVRVATIPATEIALETIKRNIPNTPIVGALAKVTGVVALDSVLSQLELSFGRKFSQALIDANLDSVRRAYEEVVVE